MEFGQTKVRCYLEITKAKTAAGYLHDEIITRTDLGFITDGDDEEFLFFSPENELSENIDKFLNDFDEISIINCTDLFTTL